MVSSLQMSTFMGVILVAVEIKGIYGGIVQFLMELKDLLRSYWMVPSTKVDSRKLSFYIFYCILKWAILVDLLTPNRPPMSEFFAHPRKAGYRCENLPKFSVENDFQSAKLALLETVEKFFCYIPIF